MVIPTVLDFYFFIGGLGFCQTTNISWCEKLWWFYKKITPPKQKDGLKKKMHMFCQKHRINVTRLKFPWENSERKRQVKSDDAKNRNKHKLYLSLNTMCIIHCETPWTPKILSISKSQKLELINSILKLTGGQAALSSGLSRRGTRAPSAWGEFFKK